MSAGRWRHAVLGLIVLATALGMASVEPIAQDLAYHGFADRRPLLGVPSALDVVTNLPFLVVGMLGLVACGRLAPGGSRRAWIALFLGVAWVSVGSAYYHWHPTSDTLVWDRLPMTVGFMGLFVALLAEHVEPRLGRLLAPALALGALTVLYWHWTDDLRPYYWVQLVPLLTVPAVLLLYDGQHTHRWLLGVALGAYLLAKVAEVLDVAIFRVTAHVVSGHSLKHLLAAAGCLALVLMLRRRHHVSGLPTAPAAEARPG